MNTSGNSCTIKFIDLFNPQMGISYIKAHVFSRLVSVKPLYDIQILKSSRVFMTG